MKQIPVAGLTESANLALIFYMKVCISQNLSYEHVLFNLCRLIFFHLFKALIKSPTIYIEPRERLFRSAKCLTVAIVLICVI